MANVRSIEDLEVYKLAYQLAVRILHLTEKWPSRFGWLANQIMRSSESVPANIAEGFESQYPKEYLRALYVARREAAETKVHLKYAVDASLTSADDCKLLCGEYDRIGQMLWGLIQSISRRSEVRG
ncbi:four helix bundle protein [Acidobacteria bacterium AH-259-D05]|nr:four helix bundle protein [Acidobacteria bacterium AH-259-D05]